MLNSLLQIGKKATQNRRRDEETYRIQFETRNDAEVTQPQPARLDKSDSNKFTNRPKRRNTTTNIASPVSKRKVTKKSVAVTQTSKKINQAVNQADEINKIKKKIEQTKTKRMKQIKERRSKLTGQIFYGKCSGFQNLNKIINI